MATTQHAASERPGRATPGRHAGRPRRREGPEPEEALGHSLLPPASLLLASHWLSLSESQPIGEEGPADAAWRGSPARARRRREESGWGGERTEAWRTMGRLRTKSCRQGSIPHGLM